MKSKATILIVDDNLLDRKALTCFLKPLGYAIRSAASGKEALSVAVAEPPDLIILDIVLPEMDGFEVCERLKSMPETSEIPVLCTTALTTIDANQRALECGAEGFITKPFNKILIEAYVKAFVRMKQINDERKNLLHFVVHDMRSPVTALKGALSIANRLSTDPTLRKYLDIACNSSNRLMLLIDSMLDLYKMESGVLQVHKQPTRIDELALKVMAELHSLSERKGAPIETSMDENLSAYVDQVLLTRLVQNLLDNALRYGRSNQPIQFAAGLENGTLQISVANVCDRLSEYDLLRIFDKFAQAELSESGKRQGSGLGLPFCKMVAEAHGGSLEATSPIPGKQDGIVFQLEIPAGPGAD